MIKDSLKINRSKASISQEKLAEVMQVSRQTISKWENGETYPSTKHILMLAKILDCSVDELVNTRTTKNDSLCTIEIFSDKTNQAVSEKRHHYLIWFFAAITFLLVGVGGLIINHNVLTNDVKNIGFNKIIDGSLNSAFNAFEQAGYTEHKVIGYGITKDDIFFIKCSLDGTNGPCAALVYFCETSEGDFYKCEYLEKSEFVPEGRYYEVG